jgi:two-component system, NarL family, nitrate/nitrite response regulator NarL
MSPTSAYDLSNSASPERAQVETILISENALFSMGLKQILSGTPFRVSAVVSKATLEDRSCLPALPDTEPALFIVDANDCSSATVKVVERVRTLCPHARIMVLADQLDLDPMLLHPVAQVDGICSKTAEPAVVVKSLELILAGGSILPFAMIRSLLNRMDNGSDPSRGDTSTTMTEAYEPKAHGLSRREGEILRCLMEGAPNKLIARQFGLTEATVKVHVKAILRKTGMKNRTQAAIWAASHGSSESTNQPSRQ